MERVKKLPFYRRFAFRVFLYDILLIIAFAVPGWILWNADFQDLIDRIGYQKHLFRNAVSLLDYSAPAEWEAKLRPLSGVFDQQKFLVFDEEGELFFDCGAEQRREYRKHLRLIFPHPYIDYGTEQPVGTEDFVRALRKLPGVGEKDYGRLQQRTWTIDTGRGFDRILVMGKAVRDEDGRAYLLVLSSSVLDILLQKRAMKERFLLTGIAVGILAILLTRFMSRSVTRPFNALYDDSTRVLRGEFMESTEACRSASGEIAEICRALGSLMRKQHLQSKKFRNFSSDVVHELKTPLAAVRSGWEMLVECGDEEEREALSGRIQRRMLQMESMMDEIADLGRLESPLERESCREIDAVLNEIEEEFPVEIVRESVGDGLGAMDVPIGCEKLYRVIANLVDNAVSFSPEDESVRVTISEDEDRLAVTVRDKGPGIPEEVFSDITSRFFTYRRDGKGKHSGLGLAIVDAILNSCRGSLSYRNHSEGGAEFTVSIPRLGSGSGNP